jgi:hypothetical protein
MLQIWKQRKSFPYVLSKCKTHFIKFEKPKDILGFNQLPLMHQWPFVIVNHIDSQRSQMEKNSVLSFFIAAVVTSWFFKPKLHHQHQ